MTNDRTPTAEGVVLAALLDADEDEARRMLREFFPWELYMLRQAFFIGTALIDDMIKKEDHA